MYVDPAIDFSLDMMAGGERERERESTSFLKRAKEVNETLVVESCDLEYVNGLIEPAEIRYDDTSVSDEELKTIRQVDFVLSEIKTLLSLPFSAE